jgi:hypothetical protein
MATTVSFNPDQTTLGHVAKEGFQRMQRILDDSAGSSRQPTLNEMHQERANFQKEKDNVANVADVANTAAAGAIASKAARWTSSSTNTITPAAVQKEADKGAVAAKRAAGSTESTNTSSGTGETIDYAQVHLNDLKKQFHDLKSAAPGPDRDAKHNELKTKIAAIESSMEGGVSKSSDTTGGNKSTSSAPTTAADAKTVQAKLKAEITELENEQAVSPTAEREDKLKQLQQNLNYVNRFLIDTKNKANTDLSVSV